MYRPCLALNIKRDWLFLNSQNSQHSQHSQIANSKTSIFERLMEDWLCQINIVETNKHNFTGHLEHDINKGNIREIGSSSYLF